MVMPAPFLNPNKPGPETGGLRTEDVTRSHFHHGRHHHHRHRQLHDLQVLFIVNHSRRDSILPVEHRESSIIPLLERVKELLHLHRAPLVGKESIITHLLNQLHTGTINLQVPLEGEGMTILDLVVLLEGRGVVTLVLLIIQEGDSFGQFPSVLAGGEEIIDRLPKPLLLDMVAGAIIDLLHREVGVITHPPQDPIGEWTIAMTLLIKDVTSPTHLRGTAHREDKLDPPHQVPFQEYHQVVTEMLEDAGEGIHHHLITVIAIKNETGAGVMSVIGGTIIMTEVGVQVVPGDTEAVPQAGMDDVRDTLFC